MGTMKLKGFEGPFTHALGTHHRPPDRRHPPSGGHADGLVVLAIAGAALTLALALLAEDLAVEFLTVLVDSVLHVVVERDQNRPVRDGLVVVVEQRDVRVLQGLLHSGPLAGVEHQQPLHQVHSVRGGAREHLLPRPLGDRAEVLEHGFSEGGVDAGDVLRGGAASDGDDPLQLVHRGGPREHRLARQKLPKDASHGPHVDALGVLRAAQEDLRGTVPPGGDVVRQHGLHGLLALQAGNGAGQPKVAQLHVALAVQQHVAGLEIAVQQLRAVEVLHGLQQLVDQELLVDVLQDVRPDHRVQIRLHVLKH
eukprot:RCo029434